MINKIQLLRNVGQFDSVNGAATLSLAGLTLVYAENGRGKTTLAAILRSLASGDPVPIAERRRLASQHTPEVIIDCAGNPSMARFQNNVWSRTLPNLAIFDDLFVDQNVYSGLSVEAEHRQNLHELILGAGGISLNKNLQKCAADVEAHNVKLRNKAADIPTAERGGLSIDDFCALPQRADIDEVILSAERNLAAIREQDPIRATQEFVSLNLPVFDIVGIETVLGQDLPTLEAAAATRIQSHLSSIGTNGETWIADGMNRLPPTGANGGALNCPFCAQDISTSEVIGHYRAYFGSEYSELKQSISNALTAVDRQHNGEALASFERAVRIAGERRQFWSQFCDVPAISLDTAIIGSSWRTSREAVLAALRAKQAAPLESLILSEETRDSLLVYESHRQELVKLNNDLQSANLAIRIVKERAANGNPTAIAADAVRLRAIKARHIQPTANVCEEYLAEKVIKTRTETIRDQTRAALDQYRVSAFPRCQTAINIYLERFNADFRIDSVSSANTRSGPSCTYNVLINNIPVAIAGAPIIDGQPSFRNTLSAGDRTTLALAFFFASLDHDPDLQSKVVVIDDPVSSMDEHRILTTVQEIRHLRQRSAQVIVLSHTKSFLCRIWEGADRDSRAAIRISRQGQSSTITAWDVDQDSITEHDLRHAKLRDYVSRGSQNAREVAPSIRLILESFIRVAYPEQFRPESKIGQFRNQCEQKVGTAQEILDRGDCQELRNILEYANKFHHDTNPAWETESINDTELKGFAVRSLRFCKRK